MDYRQYVIDNQEIIQAINDRTPGNEYADKLYGTLDIACSRFHSIMLKLINEPLKADQYNKQLTECKNIIDLFYSYTNKYMFGNKFLKWYYKAILHFIGKTRIPKIKKLLDICKDGDDTA